MKRLIVSWLLLCLTGCIVVPAGGPVAVPPPPVVVPPAGPPPGPPPGHHPKLHPSDAAALRNHIKHGYKSLRKGDCDSALAEFEQALHYDPYDPDAQAGWQEAQQCLQWGGR